MSRSSDFSSSLDLLRTSIQAVKALIAHEVFICVFFGQSGPCHISKSSFSKEKSNVRVADVVYAKVIIDMHRQ